MSKVEHPPNIREAPCCGHCRYWEWFDMEAGACTKFSNGYELNPDCCNICDGFDRGEVEE